MKSKINQEDFQKIYAKGLKSGVSLFADELVTRIRELEEDMLSGYSEKGE